MAAAAAGGLHVPDDDIIKHMSSSSPRGSHSLPPLSHSLTPSHHFLSFSFSLSFSILLTLALSLCPSSPFPAKTAAQLRAFRGSRAAHLSRPLPGTGLAQSAISRQHYSAYTRTYRTRYRTQSRTRFLTVSSLLNIIRTGILDYYTTADPRRKKKSFLPPGRPTFLIHSYIYFFPPVLSLLYILS